MSLAAPSATAVRPTRPKLSAPIDVRPAVSLIIPAHDEAERLPDTLRQYVAAIAARYGPHDIEILVVVNGSTDDTAKVAARLAHDLPGVRVLDIPEPIGKGGAVLAGFRAASGRVVLYADADGATDPASLLALAGTVDGADGQADVAIGTRYAAASRIVRPQPWRRRLLSRMFNLAARHLFGLRYRDTQCGAKAFRGDVVRPLLSAVSERSWAFDLDLLLAARRTGLRVAEVPVTWTDVDGSHLDARRIGPAIVGSLWRLWRRERATPRSGDPSQNGEGQPGRMRILALNWRDPRHPDAGGAELNLFEQARRWADQGHQVTVVVARRAGEHELPATDELDGVAVRRMGGRFSVYLHAAWYMVRHASRHDRVLDVANGIPFFAPLFTTRPVALLVHHVHDRQWFSEFPGPIAVLGWVLERFVVPLVYRGRPTIAVSPTTRDALVETGFTSGQVHVVYNGVTVESVPDSDADRRDAARRPVILYLGRLKRYKRLDRLVRAFSELHERAPGARLVIAGGGDAAPELRELAGRLGVQDAVEFPGVVDEATKARLFASATVFATPSMHEGWGLSVIEANAHGTPAVAYDVPGLRTAIRPGETGLLAEDDDRFRDGVARLIEDPEMWLRLSRNARAWAGRFDWDTTAGSTLAILATGHPEPARATSASVAG